MRRTAGCPALAAGRIDPRASRGYMSLRWHVAVAAARARIRSTFIVFCLRSVLRFCMLVLFCMQRARDRFSPDIVTIPADSASEEDVANPCIRQQVQLPARTSVPTQHPQRTTSIYFIMLALRPSSRSLPFGRQMS